QRVIFENQNDELSSHESFSHIGEKASVCFEVSSEGELEQIKPLINKLLESSQKIELVFCSDSVTHQCKKIFDAYPHLVRLFRLPILTYNPFNKNDSFRNWRTSSVLVMCRYDFFPELLKKKNDEKLILVWGSLKSYQKKSELEKFLLKKVYKLFDFI